MTMTSCRNCRYSHQSGIRLECHLRPPEFAGIALPQRQADAYQGAWPQVSLGDCCGQGVPKPGTEHGSLPIATLRQVHEALDRAVGRALDDDPDTDLANHLMTLRAQLEKVLIL
jgi:hypothetical protein